MSAPMGPDISSPELVAAVANAGGLGLLRAPSQVLILPLHLGFFFEFSTKFKLPLRFPLPLIELVQLMAGRTSCRFLLTCFAVSSSVTARMFTNWLCADSKLFA